MIFAYSYSYTRVIIFPLLKRFKYPSNEGQRPNHWQRLFALGYSRIVFTGSGLWSNKFSRIIVIKKDKRSFYLVSKNSVSEHLKICIGCFYLFYINTNTAVCHIDWCLSLNKLSFYFRIN